MGYNYGKCLNCGSNDLIIKNALYQCKECNHIGYCSEWLDGEKSYIKIYYVLF